MNTAFRELLGDLYAPIIQQLFFHKNGVKSQFISIFTTIIHLFVVSQKLLGLLGIGVFPENVIGSKLSRFLLGAKLRSVDRPKIGLSAAGCPAGGLPYHRRKMELREDFPPAESSAAPSIYIVVVVLYSAIYSVRHECR